MKYLFLPLILLITGCTPHLSVNVIKAPSFNTKNKSVAVSQFNNDYLGLSTKIESDLSSLNLKRGDPDYLITGTVFNPDTTRRIYRTTKNIIVQIPIYKTIPINTNETVRHYSQMNQHEHVRIQQPVNQVQYYKEERRLVDVDCIVDRYSVESNIKIIDRNQNIVFSKNINKSQEVDFCNELDGTRYRFDYTSLRNSISYEFTEELIEKNYFKSVSMIDELENKTIPDFKTKTEHFENALKNVKDGNIDKAILIFKEIDDNSVRFNLGLIEESKNNYNTALELYFKAGTSKEVKIAIQRVKETLKAIQER